MIDCVYDKHRMKESSEKRTINRVLTTQMGFVTIAEATPAVIAEAICIRYSGRPKSVSSSRKKEKINNRINQTCLNL